MEIKEFVPLAPYTTLKIGGPARYFCDIHSIEELTEALAFARDRKLPTFVLGGGSNVLISDSGFFGLALHMMILGINWEDVGDETSVAVGAGVMWDEFVMASVKRGYWGVENLSGIPGSVGASVIQNIGCYGVEVSEVVEWVEVYDVSKGTLRTMSPAECLFAYRDSIWKHDLGKGLIVTKVGFRLTKNGSPTLSYKDLEKFFSHEKNNHPTQEEIRVALLMIRAGKFPDLARYGTAGSFFKHPIVTNREAEEFLKKFPDAPHYDMGGGRTKLIAGWIIDHALLLRGMRKGNVGTWEKQALVLVNYGGASGEEMKAFAHEITDRVFSATNITFDPEVVFVE